MSYFTVIGKTLDQPLLVSKISDIAPKILTAGAVGYGFYNTCKAPGNEKNKAFVKNLCVLGATVSSALVAIRGVKPFKIKPIIIAGKKVFKGFNFKGFDGLISVKSKQEVSKTQTRLIEDFVKENPVIDRIAGVLDKAKTKVLKLPEVKILQDELGKTESGKKFLKELIPDPENITSKEIFGEIGRLSLLGLVPVLGGVSGGIVGDALTEKKWKNFIPDKIKEGSYQYLANIFLCNAGAGAALGIMEKMNVKSKAARALGMVGGITAVGILGGSIIANYIGKKVVNPIFYRKCKNSENIFSERTPEALDIGLHADDIAIVAVMSGLKWIQPALPILYSISGYRAGIGYRNGEIDSGCNEKKKFRHKTLRHFHGSRIRMNSRKFFGNNPGTLYANI